VDYYGLHFQIAFAFRDAKQHVGLPDFRAVSECALKNSVGLAFFMGNLSSYLLSSLRERSPEVGVSDLKSYYRGRRYVLEALKCLPEYAEAIVCSRLLEQVSRLGCIHSRQKHAVMT
jgi:hypothetical protein